MTQQSVALLTERQTSEQLNIPMVTLRTWRTRGGGPMFVKLGRVVRYRQRDLDAWIEARVHANTAA